jgi:DNA-binding NarL/FixJ family response regulator
VAGGDAYLSPSVADSVLTDYRRHVTNPLDLLSAREREVLQLISEGRTNTDIAQRLSLSVHTVDSHRSRLMEKLNLNSTGELVRFAIRHGLVT